MPTNLLPRSAAAVLILFTLGAASCNRGNPVEARVFRMGERVQVGPLIYNVLDTEWRTQLGEGLEARQAKNRFLIVQLSVTNSGANQVALPALNLEDPQGSSYSEFASGEGVNNWLGLLRKVGPAQTEQGTVIFDVPTGAYRLRVTDGAADPSAERTALVELPLRIGSEPAPPIPVPEAAQPRSR